MDEYNRKYIPTEEDKKRDDKAIVVILIGLQIFAALAILGWLATIVLVAGISVLNFFANR